MLFYETIDPKTLELLKKLHSNPEFKKLRLVGGTSLALQIGHRKSIDIDLFGEITCDSLKVTETLNKIGKTTILQNSDNIHLYVVDNIKVDIVNYSYKWLEPSIKKDNLYLADKIDIAAMKLSAITGGGTKKDFIDLFFLLQSFSLEEMLQFYKEKYHDGSIFLVLKSLSYFEDAEKDPDPIMLTQYNWNKIKMHISSQLKNYCK